MLQKKIRQKFQKKIILSFIVPSTQAVFAICLAREILFFKKLPALGSSVHMLRFLQSLLKKFLCWGRPRPEFQKLAVEKDIHHLQDLYTCQFCALPLQSQPCQGLQTDLALILQGAKETTSVTSRKSCLPTAHGRRVKPSDRF